MVNDYVARKRRKKRSREELDADPAESDKRARKKRRPAVRRLCKGMCYLKPERKLLVTDPIFFTYLFSGK